jgi:hypothetical protein
MPVSPVVVAFAVAIAVAIGSLALSRARAHRLGSVAISIGLASAVASCVVFASLGTAPAVVGAVIGTVACAVGISLVKATGPKVRKVRGAARKSLLPIAAAAFAFLTVVVLVADLGRIQIPLLFESVISFLTAGMLVTISWAIYDEHRKAPGLTGTQEPDAVTGLWLVWWRIISVSVVFIVAMLAVFVFTQESQDIDDLVRGTVPAPTLVAAAVALLLVVATVVGHRMGTKELVPRRVRLAAIAVACVALLVTASSQILFDSRRESLEHMVSIGLVGLAIGGLYIQDVVGNHRLNRWPIDGWVGAGAILIATTSFLTIQANTGSLYWDTAGDVEWDVLGGRAATLALAVGVLAWALNTLGSTVTEPSPRRMQPSMQQSLTIDPLMFAVLTLACVAALSLNVADTNVDLLFLNVVALVYSALVLVFWGRHIKSEQKRTRSKSWRESYMRELRIHRAWQLGLAGVALVFAYGLSVIAFISP